MGRGLSPQQRLILEVLGGARTMAVEELSWAVAEAFDRESRRIYRRGQRIAFDRDGRPQVVERGKRLLTGAHRASFSRSLRRLEDRGLLVRFDRDGILGGRTYWVRLTDEGRGAPPAAAAGHASGPASPT